MEEGRQIFMHLREEAFLSFLRAIVLGGLVLAIPLALITTNVRVAISEKAVYDHAVRNYGAEEASGIPEAELVRANGEIHAYLTERPNVPLSPTVQSNSGEAVRLFSAKETAHMVDVRDLVGFVFGVQLLAVAAVLMLAVAVLVLWPLRALAVAALYGSILTVAILGLASLVALTGFDAAWSQFHGIAFTNDFWELDPNRDHLIQMFPESFWFDITMLIGVATVLQAVLMSAAAVAYLVYSAPRRDVAFLPAPRREMPEMRRRLGPPDATHYTG
jgi:integral membrane protein (TIGR01906 family)